MQEITIKLICLMEGNFENVQYKGSQENFLKHIAARHIIKISDKGKEIYLNSDYIMSFEL